MLWKRRPFAVLLPTRREAAGDRWKIGRAARNMVVVAGIVAMYVRMCVCVYVCVCVCGSVAWVGLTMYLVLSFFPPAPAPLSRDLSVPGVADLLAVGGSEYLVM